MNRFITITAAALSVGVAAGLLAVAAKAQTAQQFDGTCTNYTKLGQPACEATQWCRWQVSKKAPTLPNGQVNASCIFKPGHKAGYAATATK